MAGRSKNPGRREDKSGRSGMPSSGAHRTQKRKHQRERTYERACESPLNTSVDSEASVSSSTSLTREEAIRYTLPRYMTNDGPIQVGANGGGRKRAGGRRFAGALDSARGLSDKGLGVPNNPAGSGQWSGGSQSFSPPDEETLATFQDQLLEVTEGVGRMRASGNNNGGDSRDNGFKREDRAEGLIFALRGTFSFPKELLHSQAAGDFSGGVDEAKRRL